MKNTGKHRKSAEVRRQDIILATLELLRHNGVDKLTTREISRAAGIAQPTLFLHFGHKDQILIALVDHIQAQLEEGLKRQNLQALGPVDRLRAVIRFHLKFIQQQPGIPRLLFSEQLQSGDISVRERMHQLIGFFLEFLSTQIRQAQELGELRAELDPQQCACVLIASIQGLAFRWILSEFRFVLEEQAELVISTFFDGWQPRAGT